MFKLPKFIELTKRNNTNITFSMSIGYTKSFLCFEKDDEVYRKRLALSISLGHYTLYFNFYKSVVRIPYVSIFSK